MKKPICTILRTNKNNNFKFPIKFLMTLHKSYIGYLGFLGIDFLKSVLMYSKGAICLSRLIFFTVYQRYGERMLHVCFKAEQIQGGDFLLGLSLFFFFLKAKDSFLTLMFLQWTYCMNVSKVYMHFKQIHSCQHNPKSGLISVPFLSKLSLIVT